MDQKRLLLVEDESDLRLMMADSLSAAGFEVVEAEDSDQAIKILEDYVQIDLLVTDIRMPGRYDGNDLAASAKASHGGLPVVYVTGSPHSLTNAVGPYDAFFIKPFRPSEMVTVIHRLLANVDASGSGCLRANFGPLSVGQIH